MATVIVTIVFKVQRDVKDRHLNEEILKERSGLLKAQLENMPMPLDGSPKRIEVFGSFGPMGMLLDQPADRGHRSNFRIQSMNMPAAPMAMLWEVVEMLDITPKQEYFRAHIRSVFS